jgi:hypothetical protein
MNSANPAEQRMTESEIRERTRNWSCPSCEAGFCGSKHVVYLSVYGDGHSVACDCCHEVFNVPEPDERMRKALRAMQEVMAKLQT